jgi:3-oxoacyl-[acyl-carrier protein] reductase
MSDKLVLLTGASRGIGQAILKSLCQEKIGTVIATATGQSGIQAIEKRLQEHGTAGQAIAWDALADNSHEALLDTIKATYDRMPDILINNAGITRDNLLLRMKPAEWRDVLQANLTAIFHLSQACTKSMIRKRWGRIVNISSVVARIGNAGQANYAAAKAGVVGFSKSLAAEVASRNITVNCICPGFIETDMLNFLSDAQRQEVCKKIPMGRLGDVEEIAHAVSFLISNKSSYITGTCLDINGGLVML